MSEFDKVLLRLKERTGLQTDKQIAQLLGISPTAFNDRKKRDSFPANRLVAIANEQPNIDVNYVLTGATGDWVPVLAYSLREAATDTGHTLDGLCAFMGMNKDRVKAVVSSVLTGGRVNLTPNEHEMLVSELGVRAAFLVNGHRPVLRGTAEVDPQEFEDLKKRVTKLEAVIKGALQSQVTAAPKTRSKVRGTK